MLTFSNKGFLFVRPNDLTTCTVYPFTYKKMNEKEKNEIMIIFSLEFIS